MNASPYEVVFQDYIALSLHQDIAELGASGYTLTTDVRDQALHTLEYALSLPEYWSDACTLLLRLAPFMEKAGYRKTWIPFLENALHQSQTQHDRLATARIRYHLGVLAQRQAQFADAQHYFEASVTGFQGTKTPGEAARALSSLADIRRRTRHFDEAKVLVQRALVLTEAHPPDQAYSYIIQGAIAYDRRQWTEALTAFQQAHACGQAGKDLRVCAWALTNAGATYQRLDQPEAAADCFRQSLALLEVLQDVVFMGATYMNLGNVYLNTHDASTALRYYARAEPIFVATQAWRPLASVALNQAMAYSQLSTWHEAESAYRRSLECWEMVGNGYQKANVLDGLGSVYAAQGRIAEARDCFRGGLVLLGDSAADDPLCLTLTTHLAELPE